MHVLWWLLISGIVLAYTVGCTKFFRLLKKANDEVEKTKEIIRNYENVISKPVNEIRYLIRQNLVESVAKERSVNKRVNESIKSLRYHFLFPFFTKKSRRIMTELEES
ncbi:MAG: hypothetical protein ACTSPO_14035 [Candidatus Heimdallarchaeaceae archaeon]